MLQLNGAETINADASAGHASEQDAAGGIEEPIRHQRRRWKARKRRPMPNNPEMVLLVVDAIGAETSRKAARPPG
jgi:hypothetical protein